MDLLKKLKSGASKAADVAQQTVEMTKLAAQITVRKREIEKYMTLIGQEVYEARASGDPSLAEARVEEWCKIVSGLKQDIATLERQMRYVRNEKTCLCGKAVPGDANYCPSCGREQIRETHEVIDVGATDVEGRREA